MSASKLRVGVKDGPNALCMVVAAVDAALGDGAAAPEFQEIERCEVVVQLELADDVGGVPPGEVARCVARRAPELEVLSAWQDRSTKVGVRCGRPLFALVREEGPRVPPVARRALHSQLPTAQWGHAVDEPARRDRRPGWTLAVPLAGPGGERLIALSARSGRLRYDPLDAKGIADAYRFGLAR